MTKKDIEMSKLMARRVGRLKQHCYRNAFVALAEPEMSGGLYCEGWAVLHCSWLTVEHAWLELGDTVIDPTLAAEPMTYFAGLRMTYEQAHEASGQPGPTQKPGDLPISWRCGWGGAGYPGMREAFDAARQYAVQGLEGLNGEG